MGRYLTWKDLALIQIGGVICIPAFLVGHLLVSEFGLVSAIWAIGVGNLFLLALAHAGGRVSVDQRLTTPACAEQVFGSSGKYLFGFIFFFVMVGWFSIQLKVVSESLFETFGPFLSMRELNALLGCLMTVSALKGMRALSFLANLSAPVLVATIGYAVFQAGGERVAVVRESTFEFGALSLVLAAALGMVIDAPTYMREARSKKDMFITLALLFLVVNPLIQGVGVYLSLYNEGEGFVQSLQNPRLGPIWAIWVGLFLLLAGWTTNNINLYSGMVCLQTAIPKLKKNYATLLTGLLGTGIVTVFHLSEEGLVALLNMMGIVVAGMGGVMTLEYLLKSRQYWGNIACCLFGIGMGFTPLTTSGIVNAFIGAAVLKGLFYFLPSPQLQEERL